LVDCFVHEERTACCSGPDQRGAAKACLGKKNPIILEIGANIGQTSRWFLDMFPECQFYCFEPDPMAARQFSENVGDHTNVHFF
jgi:hypothetical protein